MRLEHFPSTKITLFLSINLLGSLIVDPAPPPDTHVVGHDNAAQHGHQQGRHHQEGFPHV